MAMTILSALHDALTMWSESGSEADAYKLEDAVWHLTEYYENQRTKVQALDPLVTGCGALEANHGMGWVCKVPLKVSYVLRTVYPIGLHPSASHPIYCLPTVLLGYDAFI